MLVLHGSWVAAQGGAAAQFALWGESWAEQADTPRRGAASRARRRNRSGLQPHPFASTADELRAALAARRLLQGATEERIGLWLPSAAGQPLGSSSTARGGGAAEDTPITLAAWAVDALVVEPGEAPALLLGLVDEATAPDADLGDDLRYWMAAARFALELLYRQRLVPTLERQGDTYLARWRPVLDDPADAERVRALADAMPAVCRALFRAGAQPEANEPRRGHETTSARRTASTTVAPRATDAVPVAAERSWEDAPAPRALLEDFLVAVVDALARQAAAPAAPTRPNGRNSAAGRWSAAESWLEALSDGPTLAGPAEELAGFYSQYRAWVAPADVGGSGVSPFRLCLRLSPPADAPADAGLLTRLKLREAAPDESDRARGWLLEYLLQATDDPSLLVPAAEVWRRRGASAVLVNRRLEQPQERLLAWLGQAARVFPPIEAGLRTATPQASLLTTGEAHEFVREKALLLQANGFGVLVPALEARLGVRLRLGHTPAAPGKTTTQATFGWNQVVDFDWEVALGDEPLTREEFEALARLKEPLVQVRGRWVELRPEQLAQALAFFRANEGGRMALPDALRLGLAPDGEQGLPITEVVAEGWIDQLLAELRGGASAQRLAEPPDFVGTLRPYQRVGVSWLATLRRYGLGACLADDMGLGKTPTLIALLLHARAENGPGSASTPRTKRKQRLSPTLVICPTSVVGNWRRELERFAPALRVLVHHGADRNRETFAGEAAKHDVVISTYALLHRDEEALAAVEWDAVVLDEAQNIKNAATRAAQAARKLRPRWRAALTGTPVENRLADLWSIFQFLSPGYLGSAQEFRRRFAGPIERGQDAASAARLQALVRPFILRRVKTDRAIIADLPEKNEMKVFCPLTREQATLYQAIVRQAMPALEEAEGIQRRGQILGVLTRLKEVCDHPALFLHDQSRLDGRSGKLTRLEEMLEEVLAAGDRALVFTQYAQMGRLLDQYLRARFRREVLFLHGGTPAARRDEMVARFQDDERGPQVFVLSLKAGGTGLNLTRANHVFHFDRWWNPAVENQATDRAFRIGQRRDVQVHKLLCAGTFEETLDQLIERKVALAEAIVGTSEAWITELSTDELRDLFALRADAVAEE